MDLKTMTTSVMSNFEFNGTVFDLVTTLRELALSDLNHLVDTQMVTTENFEDSEEIISAEFQAMNEGEEETDNTEFYVETNPIESTPVLLKDTIDLDFTTKLDKFSSVVKYLNEIIKTDGVVTDSQTIVQDILNKFSEIEGVVSFYGEFKVATTFSSVGNNSVEGTSEEAQ